MPRRFHVLRYASAVVWVGLAALLRLAVEPALGSQLPYITFFLAVAFTAWHAGSGPAAFATLLGYVAADRMFLVPRSGAEFAVGSVMYFAVCVGMIWLRVLEERARRGMAARAEKLRASDERFRSLVEASAQLVWTTTAEGGVVEASPSWTAFTGQRPEEARGFGWMDALHPDDRARVGELWARSIIAGASFELEYRLRRGDGVYVLTQVFAAPVLDAQGAVREWICTGRDISARGEAQVQSQRLAAIVESSVDAIITKTLEGIVTSWNRGAERIFGYTADEIVGQPITRLVPPDRHDDVPTILGAIARGERVDHLETERIRKDGQRIHVSLSISPLVDASGRVVGASKIARDVTDRKRAEEELRANEERARALLEFNQAVINQMGEGLYVVDPTGRTTFVNPAAERLFGWKRDELIGRRMHDVAHPSHPEDDCPVLRVARDGAPLARRDDFFLRKDGTSFPVAYSVSPIGSEGRVVALAVVFRDMTQDVKAGSEREALLAETERARAQAEAANRAKDEFLSIVSHELRTPLSAMLNWLRVLRSGKGLHTARALDSMQRSAEAQSKLIEDLLDVSRIATGRLRVELRPVELAGVVRAALETVLPAAEAKGVRVETKLDERGATVSGDAERLQQVAWNLLSNAVKFTPGGGFVEATVESGDGLARLVVRDSGQGIAPQFLPHVFDRFEQAEPAATRRHGGLGLGLAIVRHLVELHGGRVDVESAGEGQGAAFTVTLPLARSAPETDARGRT
jgi:PAS domain S-box-containing protein